VLFEHFAAADDVFLSAAFTAQIGTVVPLRLPDGQSRLCELVAADVADDGSSVMFTVDISD
jgi:hypothetical protein